MRGAKPPLLYLIKLKVMEMILKTSLERLQEIENERVQTNNDPLFHEWLKQLHVSRLHIRRDGLDRAKEIMEQWNTNVHTFNF